MSETLGRKATRLWIEETYAVTDVISIDVAPAYFAMVSAADAGCWDAFYKYAEAFKRLAKG